MSINEFPFEAPMREIEDILSDTLNFSGASATFLCDNIGSIIAQVGDPARVTKDPAFPWDVAFEEAPLFAEKLNAASESGDDLLCEKRNSVRDYFSLPSEHTMFVVLDVPGDENPELEEWLRAKTRLIALYLEDLEREYQAWKNEPGSDGGDGGGFGGGGRQSLNGIRSQN